MFRRRAVTALCCSVLLTLALRAAAEPAEVLLAEPGRPPLPIILSPAAAPDLRTVAADLADYLGRITGAKFEIKDGDGRSGIILGTLEQFPDPALDKPLELRGRFDGREAYAIRTEPGRLRLIGRTDLGASHATYRLLESIGCRWIFPAKEWEVVPSVPRLAVRLDQTDRPALIARRIWYGYGFFNDKASPGRAQKDYKDWARRNRMASSLPVRAGHAWQSVILANRKLFEDHPEYLALTGGKRQGEQLCVSNPDVRRLVAEYVLKGFEKDPAAEMASVECSDGGGHCECDQCKKIGAGTFSDQVFDMANHVAREVARKHPGKMVGCLAYHLHSEPPSFDLEPNVYVQLTAGFTSGRYTFAELCELWPKRCRNLGFYEYFSVWLWDFDRLPGGRAADVAHVAKQVRRYAELGATSLDCESGNNWGPHGRGYVLANRLMWDPKVDEAAVLADFYEKAFGPAAPAMRRYYERVDPGRIRDGPPVGAAPGRAAEGLFSRHLLGLAFRDLDEATRAARDARRDDVLARLDHLKQYLRFVHLCWLRDRATDPAMKKALALDVIRHAYRTRYTYMNHWQAIASDHTAKVAKEFKEPTWDARDKSPEKAWRDDRPVTREETDAWFAEGLAYFAPQEVADRAFSTDLAPLHPAPPAPAPGAKPSTHHYQKSARYALYSRAGEALTVSVTPGTIAWYRNRADARWTFTDAAGREIGSGRLKLDGEAHVLALRAPAPGLYFFECDDSAAGWKIALPAGTPAGLILLRERAYSHLGDMPRMYFWVPPGTRRIDYFWSGRPHQVLGPDGKVVADVKTTGEFVRVEVPAGTDGKPWSLARLAPGHLYFFNVPNVLSPSPETMLVPREAR